MTIGSGDERSLWTNKISYMTLIGVYEMQDQVHPM